MCLESTEQVVQFWSGLLRAGVYVNMAVPPATPRDHYLLRCSVCAVHTAEQIDIIIERFKEIAKAVGLNLSGTRPCGEETGKDKAQPAKGSAAAMV